MTCPACAGRPGMAHTCTGSGVAVALEAHDAGAVVAPVELPTFDVHLEFRVYGPQELADELAAAIVTELLDHPSVVAPVASSVTRRET